jgi:hypothetical protein
MITQNMHTCKVFGNVRDSANESLMPLTSVDRCQLVLSFLTTSKSGLSTTSKTGSVRITLTLRCASATTVAVEKQ